MFSWNEKAQKAFERLKHLFTEESILQIFDSMWKAIMKTYTLNQSLESVLSQSDKLENLQSVAFYSWKFTGSELNYKIHDKELLAIVEAFRQWKSYLEESSDPVQVYTDHKNLIYFTIIKVLNWWQVCWSEELLNFNFKIYY